MNQYIKKYPFTKIYLSAGARKQIEKLAPEMGKKALLATSRGFAKAHGFLDDIVKSFNKTGVSLQVYSGIEPEPLDTTVEALAREIKKSKPDYLIALGGGSVIDALKVASALATTGAGLDRLWGSDQVTPLLKKNKAQLRPLIAIPSTSGSGSEVTKYAVLFDTKDKLKKAVIDSALIPPVALVDPEIMMTMPKDLTISTGLDALSHFIESFLNRQPAPDWLDPMTLQGLRLIFQNLPTAAEHPSLKEPRENMALASTLAGIAINYKGTGLPHGFSFAFRDVLSHGSAVALFLGPCWRYYLPLVEMPTRKLAAVFPVDAGAPINEVGEAIFTSLENFYRSLGHPARLSEVPGINDAVMKKAIEALLKTPSKLENSPRPVPMANAQAVLMQILKSAQ